MDPSIPIGLLAAGIGAFGGERQNKQAREEAQRNRDFQERMSSTAAQRSVEDYRKAGLNPALAYDRSASSPGGSTAPIGDVVASARAARESEQMLRIARQKSVEEIGLISEQRGATRAANAQSTAAAQLGQTQNRLAEQQFRFNEILQPFHRRQQAATALLQELGIPQAQTKAGVANLLNLPLTGWGNLTSQIQGFKDYNPSWWQKMKKGDN